ncbi:MAG: heavy-metal-associated domain-containing protein [Eubacteriales bacterium]|nr:heavy-metal-associated domain-containing protein [Eubacteriales bacterium]
MNQVIIKIDGMHCPECEVHVNDLFRKNLKHVIQVKSSHIRKQTLINSDIVLKDEDINKALDGSGYRVLGVEHKDNQKDSFSYKLALKFHHEEA